jgi:hypothetical protein
VNARPGGVRVLIAAGLALGAAPAAALGLAGGATGGGGGGGGGGSSSSGSGSGSGDGDLTGIWWIDLSIVLAFMAIIFGTGVVTTWWAVRRRQKRVAEVARAAAIADAGDGYWHPHAMQQRIREAFYPIQLSWERRDITASRPFVSDALFERHALQLAGYEEQHRVNRIEDLNLGGIEIVRLHNVTDDGEDRFVARIECSARDWMEDTRTGAVVNGNRDAVTHFVQFWSFSRHPEHGWVLDEIQQGTEGDYHLSAPLVNADEGPPAGAADTPEPAAPAP